MGLAARSAATQKAYTAIEPVIEAMIKQVETSFNEMSALNEKSREATALRMQISIALVILLVSVIAFFVGRSVSRPLKVMTSAMGELANGNLDIALPGTRPQGRDRRDGGRGRPVQDQGGRARATARRGQAQRG